VKVDNLRAPEIYRKGRPDIVKTLKCDLCEETAEGGTFDAWMQALMPHYVAAHADVMHDSSKTNEDLEKWMAANRARFEAA